MDAKKIVNDFVKNVSNTLMYKLENIYNNRFEK